MKTPNTPDVTEQPEAVTAVQCSALLEAPCECLNWPRGCGNEKWYGRTSDGVPLMTNHHPNRKHYNDSLIVVWEISDGSTSCFTDNEQDAREEAQDCEDVTVTERKMHREIFNHLPEFEGF